MKGLFLIISLVMSLNSYASNDILLDTRYGMIFKDINLSSGLRKDKKDISQLYSIGLVRKHHSCTYSRNRLWYFFNLNLNKEYKNYGLAVHYNKIGFLTIHISRKIRLFPSVYGQLNYLESENVSKIYPELGFSYFCKTFFGKKWNVSLSNSISYKILPKAENVPIGKLGYSLGIGLSYKL